MSTSSDQQWENILNPDSLRSHLVCASLYITAFELLKDSVIGRIRTFLSDWSGDEWKPGEDYSEEVLSRGASVLYASLDWLVEMEAIDQTDLEAFENVKRLRNKLAHELPEFLAAGADEQFTQMFGELHRLIDKIERWWIVIV